MDRFLNRLCFTWSIIVVCMIKCEQSKMSPRCQDGWYQPSFYSDWKGTCYYFFTGYAYGDLPMTYEDGRTFCQKQGTTLLTFKSENHFRIFTEFMDDNHRPPDIDGQNYSFWIGYSSLYNDQEIITEGVSMSWNTLINYTKFNTSFDSVTLGDRGVAMVVQEMWKSTFRWHMVPQNAYKDARFGNVMTKERGFICSKAIDDCVCGKWRNPFVFTFDGRQLPLEPHSHYWLVYSPPLLAIMIETGPSGGGQKKRSERDATPPNGLQIRQVQFWCMISSEYMHENNTIPSKNVSFILSRKPENGWFILTNVETGVTNDISLDSLDGSMSTFAMLVEDALHDFRPHITNETVEGYPPSWWTGEIYVYPFLTTDSPNSYKAVVVTTPYFKFIWDGSDIQVEINATNIVDEKLYGLCYRCKSDKTNDFLPYGIPEVEKTQKLYLYSRGTIRYPQYSPVMAGKPNSCQSYALHEMALETCRPLIDPVGPLAGGLCLYLMTMAENVINAPFKNLTLNIYQSCVRTVCMQGIQGRCYYFEKMLTYLSSKNCSSINKTEILTDMNCLAQSFCPASNEADIEIVSQWTFKNGTCFVAVDGSKNSWHPEKSCQALGSHLAVPHFILDIDNLFKFVSSNNTLIGAMSSTVRNISAIPAFRKLETFDGQEFAINLSTLLTNKNDETSCIYTINGKFERRQCNFSSPAVVVCSVRTSFDEKKVCRQTCRYPLKCNSKTKSCQDPCPSGYEASSGCVQL